MTSQVKAKIQNTNHGQAGVSLMLAVLILSAVTAVAFSLATIVFIEIRSSGDLARTEPALYGTFGVTEEALFQYKRFYEPTSVSGDFNVPTCEGPVGSNVCEINNVTLTLPGLQPIQFDDSPRVEFMAANVTKTIPLYVPNVYTQIFDSLRIEVLPNETLADIDYYLITTSENGTQSCAIGGGPLPCTFLSVSPGSFGSFNAFNSSDQYELVLFNDNPSQDISVKLETVRVGNAQPDGLPFVGESVLRIVADYLGLTRTYQVRIPIP